MRPVQSAPQVAIFDDKRPVNTQGGGTPSAGQWYARMLTYERANRMPKRVRLQSFPITEAFMGPGDYLAVDGDQTAHFQVGRWFSVMGSTGNDKPNAGDATPYLPTAVAYDAGSGRTRISVATVANATADGTIYTGRIVLQPGVYQVQASPEGTTATTLARVVCLAERTGFTYTNGYASGFGSKYTEPAGHNPIGSTTGHSLHPLSEIITVNSVEYWEILHYIGGVTADAGLGVRVNVGGSAEHYCITTITRVK